MAITWASIIARGSGTADFRLRIEGIPKQFVTAGMTLGTDSDGYTRTPGLSRDGIGFGETCYLAGAEQDIRIRPITIFDLGAGPYRGSATALFSTVATVLDQLELTLDDAATSCTVRDTAFVAGLTAYIATETVLFEASPGAPPVINLTRARFGSSAQTHYRREGRGGQLSPIYDHPPGFVGRRVWLYAHGSGEGGLSDAGTIVWRGIIAKEPSETGGAWTLQIESRAKLLDGPLAGGLDKPGLRGVYYPGRAPLNLVFFRSATAAYAPPAVSSYVTLTLAGFYESQTAFCAALTAAINNNATISSWGGTWETREIDDGGWDLYFTVPNPARYIACKGGSSVDGDFSGAVMQEADALLRPGSSGNDSDVGYDLDTVVADTTYRMQRYMVRSGDTWGGGIPGDQLRQVPRANVPAGATYATTDVDATDTSYPMGALHLNTMGTLTTADSLVIASPQEGGRVRTCRIVDTSVPGTVIAYENSDRTRWGPSLAAGSYQPEITPAVTYASGDGDLEDFRVDLLARAPDVANTGNGPWLLSDDVASWATAVGEVATPSWLAHRSYVFAKSMKLLEALREEWKLYGLIPYLDADAKLAVRPMTFETRTPDYEIDAEQRIIDGGFGKVSGDDDGLVTVVVIKTGYDPASDKHQGDTFDVQHNGAVSRVKKRALLEILPKSNAVGPDMDANEAYARALPVLEIFGARRTHTVELDVNLVMFPVLIGDGVLLTAPQLPGDGDRGIWTSGAGISSRIGYVISREWDLSAGRGTFRVLLHELSTAGYTPSGYVNAAVNIAGNQWELELDPSKYSGTEDSEFFAVNQAVRIIQLDAASPTIREGIVDAVVTATHKVTVTLSAAWGGLAGSKYLLVWDASNDAQTTATQLQSAYIANTAGRVQVVSGTPQPADRFLP